MTGTVEARMTHNRRNVPLALSFLRTGFRDRPKSRQIPWSVTNLGDSHLHQEELQSNSRRSQVLLSHVLLPHPYSSPSFLPQSKRGFYCPGSQPSLVAWSPCLLLPLIFYCFFFSFSLFLSSFRFLKASLISSERKIFTNKTIYGFNYSFINFQ